MMKQTLATLIENAKGKKILLLGKEELFVRDEIARFLKPYDIEITRYLEPEVVAVVEHPRLNPIEEELSNDAYAQGIPLYRLTVLEQLLSETIDDDALLMAIKLGNDQDRLLRLLGNPYISDGLFVRLLKLYKFAPEEEDSREDRDVIMYTLRRYIAIKPNEEDLLYSYLTLRRLATEATDPDLLEALMGFPNFSFLVRGREKITLKETIARNPHIYETTIQKLLSQREIGIDRSLAGNYIISESVQKLLFDKGDVGVLKALATNLSISDMIFGGLLQQEEAVVSLLLLHQPIDEARLAQIKEANLPETRFALLGANEQLESRVIESLSQQETNETLHTYLCANKRVSPELLTQYYQRHNVRLMPALAYNPTTPVEILEALYMQQKDNQEVVTALAHNPATPEPILRALFEMDMFEINRALATNASLPMELLDVLKLDTRLQTELAQNEQLVASYEEVLNQGKVMLNV